MVVSIPVAHPDAPPRDGMVRGQYESVEMIREIPLASAKSSSTSDLHKNNPSKSRDRGNTIGFAESRGPEAKGEDIDRAENAGGDDPETNPVEWIMITRSDPGGGIPRFMVERNTPSSIVQDAGKFLNWACSKEDFSLLDETVEDGTRLSVQGDEPRFSVSSANGILAGVGTSIADNQRPSSFRRPSQRTTKEDQPSTLEPLANTVNSSVLDTLDPLQRSGSHSSTTTASSVESFASAEQYTTAPDGLLVDYSMAPSSTVSETSVPVSTTISGPGPASAELSKIEEKRKQLQQNLDEMKEKQSKAAEEANEKSAKELEKAMEKHNKEKKRQEDKFAKEVRKLEERRERETKKLLEKQRKEADKNTLLKTQRERDEWKEKAELCEKENALLKKQIGDLQRENTVLVARVGKSDGGMEILRKVREEMEGKGRNRASSRASTDSHRSSKSRRKSKSDLSIVVDAKSDGGLS